VKTAEEVSAQRLISLFQKKYGMRVLSLAYHAALPVVITPELLHLIRINFFFEPDVALPYDAEIDLLFSDLCQEADKKYGLYEFDHTVRELLLKGLQVTYGVERIREVAALLYQYSEKNSPWVQRVELERAQQITALNFLSPEKAQEWLQMAEEVKQANSGEVNKKWFIAVRRKLIVVKSLVAGDALPQLLQDARVKLIEGVKKRWIDNPAYSNSQDEKSWHISESSSRDHQSSRMAASEAFSLLQGMAVILGEPGIGKTVALVHVAQEELKRRTQATSGRIPIILSLNEFLSTANNLQEWLVSEISAHYQIPFAIVDGLIRSRELTLLLDGLDEARTPANCVTAINEFLKTNGGVRVAVTCRTLTYSQLPPLNLNGEILPMDQAVQAATGIRAEKTVFISYRRANSPWALAIYQKLTANGFDVFFDYQGIASGDFERTILENIRSRAHFLVLLTPSALERCSDPNDWLRREIETAIDARRNIVPIFLEGFDFGSSSNLQYLTGKLADLRKYNGLNAPSDYFDQAMDRLVNRYLMPSEGSAKKSSAAEFFNLGYKNYTNNHYKDALMNFTEALSIDPTYTRAYLYRGMSKFAISDFNEAIKDFTKAIELNPSYDEALLNRGNCYVSMKSYQLAVEDFERVLKINPIAVDAYVGLGNVNAELRRYSMAEEYYSKAIELDPKKADVYAVRAKFYANLQQRDNAIEDYLKALDLDRQQAPLYEKLVRDLRQELIEQKINPGSSLRILFADNDQNYQSSISRLLTKNGYYVQSVSTIDEAIRFIKTRSIDLALLEVRLRDQDDEKDLSGLEVAKIASESNVPSIILTAFPTAELARVALRARGDSSTARDMISKMQGPEALLHAIRLIENDIAPTRHTIMRSIILDEKRKVFVIDGRDINLSTNEHKFLEFLWYKEANTATKEEAAEAVFGWNNDTDFKTVLPMLDTLVYRIRQKIETDPRNPEYLISERGRGRYRLVIYPEGRQNQEKTYKMESDENPFILGRVVQPREFVGREDVISRVRERLDSKHMQSVSIVGPRRIGKTSLLRYIQARASSLFSKNTIVIYQDLQNPSYQTIKGWMQEFRVLLSEQINRQYWQSEEDGNLSVLSEVFKKLHREGVRVIICMDELEAIYGEKDLVPLFGALRSAANMGYIGLITASAKSLSDISRRDLITSPFFNIFTQQSLQPFKRSEWRSLVTKYMDVNESELAAIEKLANGHPYYTQIAAWHLWESRHKPGTKNWIKEAEQAIAQYSRPYNK
jgi:tetratricopeptide (TPR) repeat protein/Cdc6-like AAA superfamily ATPase